MGRRPDPAGLQEAKGNPGKRWAMSQKPQQQGAGSISPPAKLTAVGMEVWLRTAPDLERRRRLARMMLVGLFWGGRPASGWHERLRGLGIG
jgi:phage terminase small subunit